MSDKTEDKSEEPFDRLNQLLDKSNENIDENVDQTYSQQYYDWTKTPKLINQTSDEFDNRPNNYLKGCKWSPDGSCVLTNSEDHCLRLFNLPENLCQNPIVFDEEVQQLKSVLKTKESELIYDFCWFPKMNSCDPSTCLFLSTSRDNPIHLWDAYSGQLIGSYRPYNYADEVVSANSIAFSSDGNKIYCGFEKMIRVFDTAFPGRVCKTKTTYFDKIGQKGIISCIAVNPYNPNILAVGSYDKSIGLYEEPELTNICVLVGQKGGVTHLQFSSDGNRLYSGGRKDCELLCWDIRNIGQVLSVIKRDVNTNQRIYFDLSVDSKYLVTGNQSGSVSVYDTTSQSDEEVMEAIHTFNAHEDCVNGVSFHPTLPLMSTTSGQRKFVDISSDSDSEESPQKTLKGENSLKFWFI